MTKQPMWLSIYGFVVLVLFLLGMYLGLVVSPPDASMGELIRMIYAHVAVAWVGFLAVALAALHSMLFLWKGNYKDDIRAVAHSEIALVFAALTIASGMTWSKPTLGVFWDWDAKLTLTALLTSLLVGYFIVRGLIDDPERRGRISAVVMIIVMASLPFNYMAAKWFRTLHPAKSYNVDANGLSSTMSPIFVKILVFNVVVAALIYIYFFIQRNRIGQQEAENFEKETELDIKGDFIHV